MSEVKVKTMSARQYNKLARLETRISFAIQQLNVIAATKNVKWEDIEKADETIEQLSDEMARALSAQIESLPQDWLIEGAPPVEEINWADFDLNAWIKKDRIRDITKLVGVSEVRHAEIAAKN